MSPINNCGDDMQVVRRTWDWLAEQPEDAAELAVLLFEAAPKLKISAGGSGGASRPPKASCRSSYKEEGGSQRRLSAGVPCPIGIPQSCPKISYHQYFVIILSSSNCAIQGVREPALTLQSGIPLSLSCRET